MASLQPGAWGAPGRQQVLLGVGKGKGPLDRVIEEVSYCERAHRATVANPAL